MMAGSVTVRSEKTAVSTVLKSRCVSMNGRAMHFMASTHPADPDPPAVLYRVVNPFFEAERHR